MAEYHIGRINKCHLYPKDYNDYNFMTKNMEIMVYMGLYRPGERHEIIMKIF